MSYLNEESIKNKPNIIYILGDDHRSDIMQHMGHPIIETPNLDQLAVDGVNFTETFCTSPACSPSRTCHYLGQWERKHGINFNSNSSVAPFDWDNSFPMQLKEQGYYLGWVGKNHVPVGNEGYKSGYMEEVFDYWYGNHGHSFFYPKEGPNGKIYSNAQEDTQVEVFAEGVSNFLDPKDDFINSCSTALPRRKKDQPFCLCLTFNLPHGASTGSMELRPSDDELYKTKYRDRFQEFPLPKTYQSWVTAKPRVPKEIYSGDYLPGYDYVRTPMFLRERMLRVCQTVTGMDRMLGQLRQQLVELDLDHNTIIIFSTDHGIHWGEHGLGGKCFLYEEDLKIPLIIYDPRMPKALSNRQINEMVVVPDIAPTVLHMMGVDIPHSMQGTSLMPLIENKPVIWRESFFAEQLMDIQNYPKSECIRTKEWKYIRYFKRTEDPMQEELKMRSTLDNYQDFLNDSVSGHKVCAYEELFHLAKDPYEEHNLISHVDCEKVRHSLRCQITELANSML